MSKMYDLVEEEKVTEKGTIQKGKPGPTIQFNVSEIPDISDYNVGEEVTFKLVTKLKELPAVDEKGNSGAGNYKFEILEAGISNLKDVRIEADRRGLKKEEWQEIQDKRGAVSRTG